MSVKQLEMAHGVSKKDEEFSHCESGRREDENIIPGGVTRVSTCREVQLEHRVSPGLRPQMRACVSLLSCSSP